MTARTSTTKPTDMLFIMAKRIEIPGSSSESPIHGDRQTMHCTHCDLVSGVKSASTEHDDERKERDKRRKHAGKVFPRLISTFPAKKRFVWDKYSRSKLDGQYIGSEGQFACGRYGRYDNA
jgi:hypothetical protein